MTKSPAKPVKPAKSTEPIRAESEGRRRKLVDVAAKLNERIANFCHEKHIDSENAAVRRLIESGLIFEEEEAKRLAQADADMRQGKPPSVGELQETISTLRQALRTANFKITELTAGGSRHKPVMQDASRPAQSGPKTHKRK